MKKIIKVPEDRVAVVIGKNGENKERLEEESGIKIQAKENSVILEGESLKVWKLKDVIKAIGRGFNPEKALKILNDYNLEVINLSEYCSTKKSIFNVKSRIIGKKGITRKTVENSTDVFISVYGKTVSLIGGEEGLEKAKEAINMLISGSSHSKVYAYLRTI